MATAQKVEKAYKIQYQDGTFIYDFAPSSLEIIKRHDLATRAHINTRVIELEGEQAAIAFSNRE